MSTTPSTDFNKISPTALLVAFARQFSDIPFTEEIATLTNAATIAKQFEHQGPQQPIAVAALIEARYKAIEHLRKQYGGTQILELASGLLPRGMIVSQNSAMTYVESDLPDMIQQKQQIVEQIIGDRTNLHFVAINVTTNLNAETLNHYFQLNQPLTILCEGLLMYLTFSEKQQVFANVREILQNYGGVWITSDLTTKAARQLLWKNSAMQQVNQKIINLTGRQVTDYDFEDLNHAKQFVQEQGFQLETFSMAEVVDQLTSVDKLGIDLNEVKSLLAETFIFALKLL